MLGSGMGRIEFRVEGLGLLGLGFRAWVSEFRVWGLGFRVYRV